ncbi:MAG: hypothetical protein IPL61_04905 [Myxococcales bacterium]|nr:hypothetical protein [Myxococcales bacterium]
MALEPTQRVFEHYAQIVHELLRVRTRLERLDSQKYARWTREYDQDIRTLMALWCPNTLGDNNIDLANTPIADLFPLAYVETAQALRCDALIVDGTIQRGRAWTATAHRSPDGGPGTAAP